MNAIFLVVRALFGIWNFSRITKTERYLNIAVNVGIALLIGLFLFVIPNPLLILAVFLIQWAIHYRVRKMMRVQVAGQSSEFLPQANAEEVLSPTVPTFVTFDANSSIREFSYYRERIVTEAETDFKRKLRRHVLLALGCFGLVLLILVAVVQFQPAEGSYLGIGILSAGLFLGVGLLISVCLRWLFIRNQFRPSDTKFELALLKNPILFYGRELSYLLHKGGTEVLLGLVLLLIIVGSVSEKDWLSTILLIGISGLYIYRFLRKKSKPGYNIRLVVLRTFNISENSLFTFGRLIQYWEHVGNYFTVVDSSYLRHKYRFNSRRTFGVLLVLQFIWLVSIFSAEAIFPWTEEGFSFWSIWLSPVSILCAVFATLLVIAFEYFRIQRGFIKSREQFQERLSRLDLRPRGLTDYTFRGVPTMCHANTWKSTVAEMVRTTDIVLMDLRGFSEKKNGCKDEINFLLDHIAIDRLLILIGAKDDEDFIQRSLLEQWRELKKDSPNLNITDPQIQIYKSDVQDETDVQGIFDRLIGAAVLSGRAAGITA